MTEARAKMFGCRLARARQGVGLSQAGLAERAGIKPSTLSSWEKGLNEPPPDAVFGIEQALGLKPGTLSHHLGYVPVGAESIVGVEEAVLSDLTLNDYRQGLLLELYRTLQSE